MSGGGRRAGEDFRATLCIFGDRREKEGREDSKVSATVAAMLAPLQLPLPIITYSLIRARRKRCTHLPASPSSLSRVYPPLPPPLSLSLVLPLRRYDRPRECALLYLGAHRACVCVYMCVYYTTACHQRGPCRVPARGGRKDGTPGESELEKSSRSRCKCGNVATKS